MKSIFAFHGAKVPMIQKKDGWLPNFESRFFRANIEYCLLFIQKIEYICNVKNEVIDRILEWYKRVGNKKLLPLLNGFKRKII